MLVFLSLGYLTQDNCFQFHPFPHRFHNFVFLTAKEHPLCTCTTVKLLTHQCVHFLCTVTEATMNTNGRYLCSAEQSLLGTH